MDNMKIIKEGEEQPLEKKADGGHNGASDKGREPTEPGECWEPQNTTTPEWDQLWNGGTVGERPPPP